MPVLEGSRPETSILIRVSWQILSKASLTSLKTIAVTAFLSSIALKRWFVTSRLSVSMEWDFLLPL